MSVTTQTIHILWEFTDGPWGGGNQFLKAIKKEFIRQGLYSDDPKQADAILFNGHQFQKQALQLKRRYPHKIFIHRIDGPMALTRGESGLQTDRKIFACNEWIADGTIFQSEWSRKTSGEQGMGKCLFETCIPNAPDPDLFHPPVRKTPSPDGRTRLVATSWSANPKKGFDIYRYLDTRLDFNRYAMTFVGNTDTPFSNIITVPPQPSNRLADILRNHDIFIAASMVESCSNSFLEAMHTGLPVVARNNSSHPELLKENGLLFEGTTDIIPAIENVAMQLEYYRTRQPDVLSLKQIAERYLDFLNRISTAVAQQRYKPKHLSLIKYYLDRLTLKKL